MKLRILEKKLLDDIRPLTDGEMENIIDNYPVLADKVFSAVRIEVERTSIDNRRGVLKIDGCLTDFVLSMKDEKVSRTLKLKYLKAKQIEDTNFGDVKMPYTAYPVIGCGLTYKGIEPVIINEEED